MYCTPMCTTVMYPDVYFCTASQMCAYVPHPDVYFCKHPDVCPPAHLESFREGHSSGQHRRPQQRVTAHHQLPHHIQEQPFLPQ